MKAYILCALVFWLPMELLSQHNVWFVVEDSSPIKRESIYISGTMNNWDSLADKQYILTPGKYGDNSILLTLPSGAYEYKYTGGSWKSVEKTRNGDESDNKRIQISRDTIIRDTVWLWSDFLLESIRIFMAQSKDDTTRMGYLMSLASYFTNSSDFFNSDSAKYYLQQMNLQLQKIKSSEVYSSWSGYDEWLIYTQEMNASLLHGLGNYASSLEIHLENLKIAEQTKNYYAILYIYDGMIRNYLAMKDLNNAMAYAKKMNATLAIADHLDQRFSYYNQNTYNNLARTYHARQSLDSALYYSLKVYAEGLLKGRHYILATATQLLGDIYAEKNEIDSAFYYYGQTSRYTHSSRMYHIAALSITGIARLFQKQGQVDSALHYARSALSLLIAHKKYVQVWNENADSYIADISPLVAELYKSKNEMDSAYKYLQLSVSLKDSLYNVEKVRQFQDLTFNESHRKQQIEQQNLDAKKTLNTKIKLYSLLVGLAAFLIIAFILYRNNRQKQIANTLLSRQKSDLEKAITDLQITQKQLIQSEKMASLGELTAGIAHEIQNPLNFVNNFSEVNTELIDELNNELAIGNMQLAKEIASNIKENEKKIIFHGKRADGIVKGMLQHSRISSGVKEPTDINALVDEYLRLAYHGLRAKDKSFNASINTDFDTAIGLISVVPEDIGRVILNLITNAFYAVSSVAPKSPILRPANTQPNATAQQPGDLTTPKSKYEPTVTVTTKLKPPLGGLGARVEIRVSDNGIGIPQHVLDKIFQPFFTTKPVGQGTGLGLSISYDIIKSHGGRIQVESKEGEGTLFIIHLPMA